MIKCPSLLTNFNRFDKACCCNSQELRLIISLFVITKSYFF